MLWLWIYTQRCRQLQATHARVVAKLFGRYQPGDRGCPFKHMNLLKLVDIYKLRVGVYMYRMIELGEYQQLKASLNLHTAQHDHDTRGHSNLVPPFPRVEIIRMSFLYQFTNVWNQFPSNIRQLDSLRKFKVALNKHLISCYWVYFFMPDSTKCRARGSELNISFLTRCILMYL